MSPFPKEGASGESDKSISFYFLLGGAQLVLLSMAQPGRLCFLVKAEVCQDCQQQGQLSVNKPHQAHRLCLSELRSQLLQVAGLHN